MSSELVSVSPLDPQISYSDDWFSNEPQVGQKVTVTPSSFLDFPFFGTYYVPTMTLNPLLTTLNGHG